MFNTLETEAATATNQINLVSLTQPLNDTHALGVGCNVNE